MTGSLSGVWQKPSEADTVKLYSLPQCRPSIWQVTSVAVSQSTMCPSGDSALPVYDTAFWLLPQVNTAELLLLQSMETVSSVGGQGAEQEAHRTVGKYKVTSDIYSFIQIVCTCDLLHLRTLWATTGVICGGHTDAVNLATTYTLNVTGRLIGHTFQVTSVVTYSSNNVIFGSLACIPGHFHKTLATVSLCHNTGWCTWCWRGQNSVQ